MSLHGQGAYGSPWQESSQTALTDLDGTIGEMEPLGELVEAGFEPQPRARSNTWPLPRPENYVEPADDAGSKKNSNQHLSAAGGPPIPSPVSVTSAKKNSSRRNAWGNLSYADLITQAITSAADNRLTLSQIYEWMVQNVPYFKDKGDSNSSAGWKNSIRHNLSLHNRFMRVQNEGTGKSSWWMINPDAKPGKSVRRRAASMETSKFEKRRGRVKKKVEALRNGMTADATPSPSSSISEGLDMFPDSPLPSSAGGFQLSPDFRQRASSNASSCGRLSPIPSLLGVEPDWAGGDYSDYAPAAGADQLAGSLADTMTLHGTDPFLNTYVPTTLSNGGGVPSGPPPPYPPRAFPLAYPAHCPRHPRQPCACIHHTMHNPHAEGVGVAGMSPSYPAGEACGDHFMGPPATPPRTPLLPQPAHTNLADLLRAGNPSLLSSQESLVNGGLLHDSQTSVMMSPATTMMGQLMGALNNPAMMEDLNLNIESLEHGGFDCNVDEVIKHELSMDGSLDFNFPQSAPQQVAPSTQSDATSQAGAAYQHAPTAVSTAVTIDDALMTQQRQPTYSAPSWVH